LPEHRKASAEAFGHFAEAAAQYGYYQAGNQENITPLILSFWREKVQGTDIEDIMFQSWKMSPA